MNVEWGHLAMNSTRAEISNNIMLKQHCGNVLKEEAQPVGQIDLLHDEA